LTAIILTILKPEHILLPPEPGSSPCQPLIFAAGCSALRPDRFTLEERGPEANEVERVDSRTRVDSLRKTKIPCSCQKSDSDSSVAHSLPVPVTVPTVLSRFLF